MTAGFEIEGARTKWDRMKLRIDQLVVDARKTGLELEEKKTGVLSDLKGRLSQAADLLQEVEQATSEEAARAADAFEKAWHELEARVARVTRPPND